MDILQMGSHCLQTRVSVRGRTSFVGGAYLSSLMDPDQFLIFLAQVLWTDYYSRSFVLFVALAVLESHRDVILRYLVEVGALRNRFSVAIADVFLTHSSMRYSRCVSSIDT